MNKTKILITVGTGLRKSGQPIGINDLDVMYGAAKSYLLYQCGAYQIHTIQGGWRDKAGSYSRDWVEPGVVFMVCVDPTKTIPPQRIAEHLRDIFDQQCVALETFTVNFELI